MARREFGRTRRGSLARKYTRTATEAEALKDAKKIHEGFVEQLQVEAVESAKKAQTEFIQAEADANKQATTIGQQIRGMFLNPAAKKKAAEALRGVGIEVTEKSPVVATIIENAAKALLLGRSTAHQEAIVRATLGREASVRLRETGINIRQNIEKQRKAHNLFTTVQMSARMERYNKNAEPKDQIMMTDEWMKLRGRVRRTLAEKKWRDAAKLKEGETWTPAKIRSHVKGLYDPRTEQEFIERWLRLLEKSDMGVEF